MSDSVVVSPSPLSPRGMRWRTRLTPYMFLLPALLLFAALSVVPIVTVIYYSTMDNVVITRDAPSFIGLGNYVELLTSSVFLQATMNTVILASVSVVGHFILGLGFAMLLDSPFVGPMAKAVFRVIYILPWVFTASIIAILWRLLLSPNGVVNYALSATGIASGGPIEWLGSTELALPSVVFINIWAGYPFYMVSFLAGLQGIPASLYEAAKIDGANALQLTWHITLPQLRPIIISLAILDFIWTTHQFTLVWMTTAGGPIRASEVLSTFTYKAAFSSNEFALASAAAVVILVMSVIIGVFYVRSQQQASA